MKNNIIILTICVVTYLLLSGCSSNCSDNQSEYRDGYSNGEIVSFSSENVSCDEWIEKMGWNESKATDCWCQGFKDGKSGKENKYLESK